MNEKPTNQEREFSVKEGLAYLAGAIGIQLTTTMLTAWTQLYYHPPEGGGRTAYTTGFQAMVMMIAGQFVNCVTTLLFGYWSDRTRSRFGRRRPFIIFGSIPFCLAFILFWAPPVQGSSPINFAWGIVLAVLAFSGLNAVLVPYISLMPEMARSTAGRVRIGAYNAVGMIVGLVLGIVSGICIANWGMKPTALVYGLFSLLCFQIAGWGVRERYRSEETLEAASLADLFSQLASTLRNRPFLVFIGAFFVFQLGFFIIQIVLPDYSLVVMKKDEDFVTLLFLPFLLVCFPLIFAIEGSVKKWNKKKVYAMGLLGFVVVFPLLAPIGTIADFKVKLALLLALTAFAGAPQAIQYVMQGPMIGEIADYDETFSGRRREALYAGAVTLSLNLAWMLSYAVRWGVYSAGGGYSLNNPAPVLLMGPVTGLVCFVGFLVFLRYPVLNLAKDDRR